MQLLRILTWLLFREHVGASLAHLRNSMVTEFTLYEVLHAQCTLLLPSDRGGEGDTVAQSWAGSNVGVEQPRVEQGPYSTRSNEARNNRTLIRIAVAATW
jgi:hypothetical protein